MNGLGKGLLCVCVCVCSAGRGGGGRREFQARGSVHKEVRDRETDIKDEVAC